MLARAEQLGGEGNVDEAQQLLEMVEKTRALKKEAEVRTYQTCFCEDLCFTLPNLSLKGSKLGPFLNIACTQAQVPSC